MTIGALVTIPELQSEGLARLTATRGSYSVIRFLASGAEMTQEARQVLRHGLLPGTRVRIRVGETETAGTISDRPIQRDQASGLLVYGLRRDDGGETVLREDAVIAVPLPEDPVEQLATVAFNDLKPMFAKAGSALPPEPWGPQTCAAREELLAWRDAAWQLTGGVVGLAAARVRPLPHQLLAARRALDDRQVRFLLADEVGLGKTIEAGLVMQSLLAIKPDLRVLVVVPGALLSQWFLELHLRFGGRAFVMLDSERLRGWTGNPWESEQFVLASSRALEELDAKGAMRLATSKWDVLVVDECHRMQPGGILYKRVAVLSKSTPHVLLLSATPARQHADAYLALLALLQPQVWRLDDLAGFTSRLAAHDRVLDLLTRTMAAEAPELPALAIAWTTAVPGDPLLAARAEAMAADPAAREALIAYAREHMQLDRRVVRNRRQVLARLSRASGIKDFAATTRSLEMVPYTPDAAEQAVRDAIAAYRTVLMDDAGDILPPRLAHWLTQVELALAAHPQVLERMLAMRAAVLEDPEEFAEYRDRARRDETLAHVLRSDLSENEVASHVAISAACNCNPGLENTALATLRAAVATWNKQASSKPTARLKALIARLKRFWDDQPQEKVLIFTTHGLAVTPLAEALGRAFGEDTVETFGAHQDTVAREESARRFQADDRCALMVCDPLGGEGRNFQFVSVVAHHDLPWSVAAVEQRIGRVDRLGRDGDIPSWVLTCDDPAAVDAAWGVLLDQAVGVFTASSSGLEFVSDAVETTALRAALSGGGTAVRAAIPTAAALVTREREARDQREDDCFHADAATYADAGRESEAVAAATAPAGAVARWIRSMGGEVRRDEERPKPWKLRTRYHDQPEEGVYDRESALTHSHLAFFGIGHRLIDKLIDDAASARWSRATAWRRPAPTGVGAWSGVRAVFTLVPDLAPLVASGLRLEVLRRLFTVTPPLRLIVCARAQDGVVETTTSTLAALRAPFSAKSGDAALSAGVNRDSWVRPLLAGQPGKITAWQDGVRRAAAATQAWAAARLDSDRATMHATLAARLDPGLAAARASASANAARFGNEHAETRRAISEAENEERQVTALQAAVAGARFDLEQIAYVALT